MSGKYWCLKKTYTGHSSKKFIFVSFSSTQNGHATLRIVGEKRGWWTLIWDTPILNWTKASCMRPSKENPHTFPLQSSSYNLCKVTAFHSILGDSTIHGKKNCTTFLLVHWKRSCHSHNQTATLVQIHYSPIIRRQRHSESCYTQNSFTCEKMYTLYFLIHFITPNLSRNLCIKRFEKSHRRVTTNLFQFS